MKSTTRMLSQYFLSKLKIHQQTVHLRSTCNASWMHTGSWAHPFRVCKRHWCIHNHINCMFEKHSKHILWLSSGNADPRKKTQVSKLVCLLACWLSLAYPWIFRELKLPCASEQQLYLIHWAQRLPRELGSHLSILIQGYEIKDSSMGDNFISVYPDFLQKKMGKAGPGCSSAAEVHSWNNQRGRTVEGTMEHF